MQDSKEDTLLNLPKERPLWKGMPLFLSLLLHTAILILVIGIFGFGSWGQSPTQNLPLPVIEIQLEMAEPPTEIPDKPQPVTEHLPPPETQPEKPKPTAPDKPQPVARPPAPLKAAPSAPENKAGLITEPQYEDRIAAHIARFRFYPLAARNRHEEGQARLSITIDSAGNLQSATIRQSTGSHILDYAALTTLRKAAPYPAPPDGAARQLIVPLSYKLDRKN